MMILKVSPCFEILAIFLCKYAISESIIASGLKLYQLIEDFPVKIEKVMIV